MRKLVNIQDWEYTGHDACTMCQRYNMIVPCGDDECLWTADMCSKLLKVTASPVFQSDE